jgi:hypothetical protein
MSNSHLYVAELPQEVQDEIVKQATKVFQSLAYKVDIEEEIENILCSRLSDISDTIDINKYL